MKIVLQKFIAQSGYCSRRKAEEMIRKSEEGGTGPGLSVRVNGELAELGMKVSEKDDVRIGRKKIELTTDKVYVKLNKPRGYTCTNRKFIGERNVFELLKDPLLTSPSERGRERLAGIKLNVVGRLDKDSRGLVLLTNDGEMTLRLTHPKYEHEKRYIVEVRSARLEVKKIIVSFKKGVNIGEGDGIVRAKAVKYLGDNKFRITLTEGKKRQIRRMFKRVGCEIVDLTRAAIGGLKLGDLKEGEWRYLSEDEIAHLRKVSAM